MLDLDTLEEFMSYNDQRSLYNRCSEYTEFIQEYGDLAPADFMTVAKQEQQQELDELVNNPLAGTSDSELPPTEPDTDTRLLRQLRNATVKFLQDYTPPEMDYSKNMEELMQEYYYGFYYCEKNIAQAFFNYCCSEFYNIDWDNREQFGILSFIPCCMDWEQVAKQFAMYGVYDLIDQHAFNTDY